MERAMRFAAPLLLATLSSCSVGTVIAGNAAAMFRTPAPPLFHVERPFREDARLAVTWIGHATALIQIDDRLVLTDPVFTDTVAMTAKRVVAPGISAAALPRVDATIVSHLHPDHLSIGSLERIEQKVGVLVLPEHGIACLPDFGFEAVELSTWRSYDRDGLRITAVPVRHVGYRWFADTSWMEGAGFTGYVLEYHGLTVYFGGDSAYAKASFVATRARFPSIDLALLPIGPINPRAIVASYHMDPPEALAAFRDLGARWMIPIHYGTFVQSSDPPGEELRVLEAAMAREAVEADSVVVLGIGEQRVLASRGPTRVERAGP